MLSSLPAYIRETASLLCSKESVKIDESINDVSAVYSGNRAFVHLNARKDSVSSESLGPRFLFDTGAAVSLITPADFRVFQKHNLVRRRLVINPKIANASGQEMHVDGVYDVQFYFQGKTCHGVFIVSNDPKHSILGMNVISEYNMVLDPVRNTVGIPTAPPLPVCEIEDGEDKSPQEWLMQVAENTVIDPGYSSRVRCRLVHPVTLKPLLKSTQFLAGLELFSIAVTSNENGSFRPHLPNNDTVCKVFSRGDILGSAQPLAEVRFITDSQAVQEVASTPPPREHTSAEKLSILKGIHERMNSSDVPYDKKSRLRAIISRIRGYV